MNEDFNAKALLLELAITRRTTDERIAALKAEIDELTAKLIKPLEAEIKAQEDCLKAREDSTRAAFLEEFKATGDKTLHESVTIRRDTKLRYDKDAALKAAIEAGRMDVIRVKQELNVRTFEDRIRQGMKLEGLEVAEEVEYNVAISTKLGALLIEAEMDTAQA